MPDMIEPNIHPILVHFTYALLTLSALSLFIVSLQPAGGWRDTLKHAGDWMLAFGAVSILATVAAGFQAYYTVAHDGPSHAAMTVHRNFAVPTAVVLLALSGWRYLKRANRPGFVYSALLLAAASMLTVTAWWGGRLVYAHGLGVMRMPQVTGEGHDHEHAPGEEHGDKGEDAADGHADHDHDAPPSGDAAEAGAEEHDMAAMGAAPTANSEPAAAAPGLAYPETPAAVADAFGVALKTGDAAMVERLLAPDVLIAEGGGAERSYAEYAGHHMPADMAFVKAVESTVKKRDIIEGHDMATVITAGRMHGTYKDKTVHSQTMETIVLRLVDGQWRIAHIHWSSAEIKGEHEH